MIGADTEKSCLKATINLLSHLGLAAYGASQKKAQEAKEKVQYLGFKVSKGQRELGTEIKGHLWNCSAKT